MTDMPYAPPLEHTPVPWSRSDPVMVWSGQSALQWNFSTTVLSAPRSFARLPATTADLLVTGGGRACDILALGLVSWPEEFSLGLLPILRPLHTGPSEYRLNMDLVLVRTLWLRWSSRDFLPSCYKSSHSLCCSIKMQ